MTSMESFVVWQVWSPFWHDIYEVPLGISKLYTVVHVCKIHIFTNCRSQALLLHVIFALWISTHEGIMPVFFLAWRLLEWFKSCNGLNVGQLKNHLYIQDKNQSTNYFDMCSSQISQTQLSSQPMKLSTWYFTTEKRRTYSIQLCIMICLQICSSLWKM